MRTQNRERIEAMRATLSTFLSHLRGTGRTTSMIAICERGDLVITAGEASAKHIRRALMDSRQTTDHGITVNSATTIRQAFDRYERYRARGGCGAVHIDHTALEHYALEELAHMADAFDGLQPDPARSSEYNRTLDRTVMTPIGRGSEYPK